MKLSFSDIYVMFYSIIIDESELFFHILLRGGRSAVVYMSRDYDVVVL